MCSTLKHSALSWSTCTAPPFPINTPNKNQAQPLLMQFLVLKAHSLNITDLYVISTCSLVGWYLTTLTKRSHIPEDHNPNLHASSANCVELSAVKKGKDFTVGTANWTSQKAKLYGIVKWLLVSGCCWHRLSHGNTGHNPQKQERQNIQSGVENTSKVRRASRK